MEDKTSDSDWFDLDDKMVSNTLLTHTDTQVSLRHGITTDVLRFLAAVTFPTVKTCACPQIVA